MKFSTETMTTIPTGPIATSGVLATEDDRGDKSGFAAVFERLVALAAEILPGHSTRRQLETRLGLAATRISKDVRSLEDLGISVGRSGHKYVVESNVFPVLASVEEARALELAHHVLRQAGLPEEAALRSLLDRVPDAVRGADSEGIPGAGGIEFPPASVESHAFAREIEVLRQIIRSGRMARLTYRSQRAVRQGEEASSRLIDRAELVFIGTVYLNAWEVLPEGGYQARVFRVDRIGQIEPLSAAVSKAKPPVFEYVYRLSAAMAALAGLPPGAVATRLDDGRLEVRATAKTDLLARMHVLRYGAEAEVVAPKSLRQAVAAVFRTGTSLYCDVASDLLKGDA